MPSVDPYGLAATGLLFAPGAGITDAAGGMADPSQAGRMLPSMMQNIRGGQYLDAGLQGLGLLGDAFMAAGTVAPPLIPVGAAMKLPRAGKVASAADVFSEVKDFPNLTKSEERVVAASSAPPEQVAGLGRVVTEPIDPQNMAASKARFDQLQKATSGYEQERAKARIVRLDDGTDAIQYMEPPATVQSVPISQLKATQPGLLSGGDAPLTEGPPLVVKKGGELFVRDGHHRLARMIEAGADTADVRVVDLDAGGLVGAEAPRVARVATKMAEVPEHPLMVQHNIHEGPLMQSDALGGLPVPSLAVSNPDNPLMLFGDVSLLGPPSMATPSAKNPVYSADAYTVRRPKVDSNPNANAEKFVDDEYFKPFGNLLDGDDAASSANAIFTGDDAYGSIPLRAKYMQEKGLLPDIDEAEDYYSFRQKVRDNFVETEDYYDWLGDQRAKMIDAGGEVNQNIFVGYTPSGRAKTKPATLENMVKQMAKEGAGAEGFSGSIAGTRAKVAPKFKTAADVRSARRRVVSPSRFEADKEGLQEIYDPFNAKIRNAVIEKSGLRSYEANRAAEELVEDLILGDWGKYEYHNQYKNIVDESILAEAKKIKTEMQNMGTTYFEAKPKRAVSLSEFEGAIVPDNATKETLRILNDAGIKKVYKYKNENERKSLHKKFPELMFSVGGLGLLGASQVDREPQPKGIMY